jgi:hypothetical protein
LIREAKNAGFANAQVLTKDAVTKERLALYPLFDPKFLNWLYAQFPAEHLPIYLAHFRFEMPRRQAKRQR